VWDIADRVRKGKPSVAAEGGGFVEAFTRNDILAACSAESIASSNSVPAYTNWCHYHSINPKDPAKPYEGKGKREKKAVVQPVPEPAQAVCAPVLTHVSAVQEPSSVEYVRQVPPPIPTVAAPEKMAMHIWSKELGGTVSYEIVPQIPEPVTVDPYEDIFY